MYLRYINVPIKTIIALLQRLRRTLFGRNDLYDAPFDLPVDLNYSVKNLWNIFQTFHVSVPRMKINK